MEELMRVLKPVWDLRFLGNTVGNYVSAVLTILAVMVFCTIFNRIILRFTQRLAENTSTDIDDLLVRHFLKPLYYIFLLLGIHFSLGFLTLSELLGIWVHRLLLAAGIHIGFVYVFRFLEEVIQRAGNRYVERLKTEAPEDLEERERTVQRIVKQAREVILTVFIIIGILTLLANLGLDLKAIWASLGIGGIAVVVAVKDPLTNIVGRIYIFSTGIFDEGHFIVFKSWAGTVKRIGFFRTYLELFSDMTTVSIPNAQFINEGVKNYYGRKKFMYKWDLDLPYEIESEKVEEVIAALKNLIQGFKETNQDRCWIYLDRLDKYSKVVRVWFQVQLPDWGTSLHYGSRVLKQIQEVFVSQGVAFAFPTSTVHVEGTPGGPDLQVLLPEVSGQDKA